MWTITGILGIAGLCMAIEYPSLKGFKKDRWIFYLLMLAAVSICIAASMKLHIPNPLDAISIIFEPTGRWMKSLFD